MTSGGAAEFKSLIEDLGAALVEAVDRESSIWTDAVLVAVTEPDMEGAPGGVQAGIWYKGAGAPQQAPLEHQELLLGLGRFVDWRYHSIGTSGPVRLRLEVAPNGAVTDLHVGVGAEPGAVRAR